MSTAHRDTSTPLRLAIVGGGPTCTYVLERLAALTRELGVRRPMEITVYDRSGEFGSGQVHSPAQTKTSYLNRIVGQVAFAADESVVDAGPLLAAHERPTLLEWCRAKYAETGDAVFDLVAEDWPKRYLHGLALNDQFARYAEILRERPGISLTLRQAEVVDLEEHGAGLAVLTADGGEALLADYVLLLTGHSANRPELDPRQTAWAGFTRRHPARLIPNAYPLERSLDPAITGPGSSVGCLGMGLTGIDVLLYLTEGRGGSFERAADGTLAYQPCGAEPDRIVPFSRTGLFTFARPYNEKERDIASLEYRGRFLTVAAVRRLRASAGRANALSGGEQRQLDFEAHVLPLIVLEMDLIYHATLFGQDFRAEAIRLTEPVYERFLADPGAFTGWQRARDLLTAPIQGLAAQVSAEIDRVLDGLEPGPEQDRSQILDSALTAFLTVVHGAEQAEKLLSLRADPSAFTAAVAEAVSPWRQPTRAAGHGFSWEHTIDPVDRDRYAGPEQYRDVFLDFLDADVRWAAQGNLRNPAKAAADAAWRDLRGVVIEAVDFGGLRSASHRRFLQVYTPHHNRLCQGASCEAMEKVAALIRAGYVDITAGPDARVAGDEQLGSFVVEGPVTGVRLPVDVLVDARVHAFDAERDMAAVYPNLLRRGLVRKWTNPGLDGEPDFVPGGLDLTRGFHPVRADGRVEERITVLGPPSEGVMYHQIGALRPNKDHHVIRDILAWMNVFLPHEAASAAGTES